MKDTKDIKPGTRVRVSYPVSTQFINVGTKFDGLEFIVRRKHDIRLKNNTVVGTYYELYGAQGLCGMPYGFLAEELEVLEDAPKPDMPEYEKWKDAYDKMMEALGE